MFTASLIKSSHHADHIQLSKSKFITLSTSDLAKKKFVHTMTKALEAAVRFIPTPPAFSDINNTWCMQEIGTDGHK